MDVEDRIILYVCVRSRESEVFSLKKGKGKGDIVECLIERIFVEVDG